MQHQRRGGCSEGCHEAVGKGSGESFGCSLEGILSAATGMCAHVIDDGISAAHLSVGSRKRNTLSRAISLLAMHAEGGHRRTYVTRQA